MSAKVRKIITQPALFACIITLAAMAIWTGCKKQPAEQIQPEQDLNKSAQSQPIAEKTDEPEKPATNITTTSKITLNDIIRSARTWGPAYQYWYGKVAPDFTIPDITGKMHTLSDYRGKNVMIIFWATWCPPCKTEVPHLIALRKNTSEDNLAMLAISHITTLPPETTQKVKDFVEKNNINYTVFSIRADTLPSPFRYINGIPCSFFIDPEGKIKIATEGLISLYEIKAILQAE